MQGLFQPVTRDLIKDRIYRELRDAIFMGKLAPGVSLPELRLARSFGVSQATVREALAQLERDNLVVRTPAKVTRVIELSPDGVMERIAVRTPLEELACILACRRMTASNFAELRRRSGKISKAIREDDFFALFRADLQFHRYIWEMSGNRMLHRVLDQVVASLFAFGAVAASNELESAREAVASDAHDKIVAALEGRRIPEIRRMIRGHGRRLWDSETMRTAAAPNTENERMSAAIFAVGKP